MLPFLYMQDNLRLAVFSEGDTYIQALLAAISLGPVGLSDELEGFPSPPAPDAGIVTNLSLALSLCTTNGTLLGPSTAAAPIEGHLRNLDGLGGAGGNVWVTYTAVEDGSGGTNAWFMVVGFTWADTSLAPYTLVAADLAPLLDGSCPTPTDFAAVPCGSFHGAGDTLPGNYVVWDPASSSPPVPFGPDAPYSLSLASHAAAVAHVAPIWPGDIVLLGEINKTVALSAYRFATVTSAGVEALSVTLRGAPGEAVELLYAMGPAYAPVTARTILGADGTGSVTLP
jgi:hypothetical protein